MIMIAITHVLPKLEERFNGGKGGGKGAGFGFIRRKMGSKWSNSSSLLTDTIPRSTGSLHSPNND